jgi:hypothetical protein
VGCYKATGRQGRCLTTGASAAGSQARAHTNPRSTARSRRGTARAEPAPLRPVGCMRGLGAALIDVRIRFARYPATMSWYCTVEMINARWKADLP